MCWRAGCGTGGHTWCMCLCCRQSPVCNAFCCVGNPTVGSGTHAHPSHTLRSQMCHRCRCCCASITPIHAHTYAPRSSATTPTTAAATGSLPRHAPLQPHDPLRGIDTEQDALRHLLRALCARRPARADGRQQRRHMCVELGRLHVPAVSAGVFICMGVCMGVCRGEEVMRLVMCVSLASIATNKLKEEG